MSILFGSASPSSTQSNAWSNLNQIFGLGTQSASESGAAGKAEKSAGLGDLGQAANYWRSLLTGNRQQVSQAVAPAANAATTQSDAAKRELAAKGTGRTGGTVASNQQRGTETQAQIDSLIGKVQPEAAKGLESIGGTVAGIGEADISAMLQALGISTTAASEVGAQATSFQEQALKSQSDLWSSLITGGAKLAAAAYFPDTP